MSMFTILTGSFFINYLSDNESSICKSAKHAFDNLKRANICDTNNIVAVVKETDKGIFEIFGLLNCGWLYKILRNVFVVEETYTEGEIEAVKRLAKNKSRTHDIVIIVNGDCDTLYGNDNSLTSIPNIKLMNEEELHNYLVKNVKF